MSPEAQRIIEAGSKIREAVADYGDPIGFLSNSLGETRMERDALAARVKELEAENELAMEAVNALPSLLDRCDEAEGERKAKETALKLFRESEERRDALAEENTDQAQCLRDALEEARRYADTMAEATETLERDHAEIAKLRAQAMQGYRLAKVALEHMAGGPVYRSAKRTLDMHKGICAPAVEADSLLPKRPRQENAPPRRSIFGNREGYGD